MNAYKDAGDLKKFCESRLRLWNNLFTFFKNFSP